MAQILVEPSQVNANLTRAGERIVQAAEAGCDVVVLPECLDVGWTERRARDLAMPIPGSNVDRLASLATSHSVMIVAGLVEREGDKLYNSAVLISASGEILIKHRKINELDIALDLYTRGSSLSSVITEIGCIGVNICADNFPDSLDLGLSLCRMGAGVILSPCAWAVDATHDNCTEPYGQFWVEAYGALARQTGVSVVGVSNVGWITSGPWRGKKCIGCSLAIGRNGEILAQGPYGHDADALIVVEVPLA